MKGPPSASIKRVERVKGGKPRKKNTNRRWTQIYADGFDKSGGRKGKFHSKGRKGHKDGFLVSFFEAFVAFAVKNILL